LKAAAETVERETVQQNSDLDVIAGYGKVQEVPPGFDDSSQGYGKIEEPIIQKKKIRRTEQDGFFQTGVDVVEDEYIDYEETAKNAAELLQSGNYTAKQLREILERKLKEDRIFSFKDFDEFNDKYFTKELVAFEEFHKIRQLKYARVKYNNRFSTNMNKLQALKDEQLRQQNHLQQAGAMIGGSVDFQSMDKMNLQPVHMM